MTNRGEFCMEGFDLHAWRDLLREYLTSLMIYSGEKYANTQFYSKLD